MPKVSNTTAAGKKGRAARAGDPLVGRWFHSFEGEVCDPKGLRWQGQVVAAVLPGAVYLVQLDGRVLGEPSTQRLVRLEEMFRFVFYDTSEQMRDAWEQSYKR